MRTFLALLLGFSVVLATAQTSVSGRVFDGESGEPLPFVNVSFAASNLGTMTDLDGMYVLAAGDERVTRMVISSLGYQSQSIPLQRGVPQVINVALEARSVDLEAAVVRPDKKAVNPAKPLMQRVAEAKPQNDPALLPALNHAFYDVQEVAINDYPERWPERRWWGPFSWVWDHLDSSQSRVALPLFVTEVSGTLRTEGRRREKRIEAARATWMKNGENTSSVQSEFLDINLYENQMLLLDRAFTSPLHDRGNVHYRYYILDTLDHGNRPCFHLAFVPRRRGELTFEGEMWIDTLTLGLRHVEAKISEGANVNFVRNYTWSQTYELHEGRWVLGREENLADVSLREGGMGIYSHQTVVNTAFELAEAWPDSVWGSARDMSFAKGANDVLEEEWQTLRSEPLTERASTTYWLVDTVQSMPQYKFLEGFLMLAGTGYIVKGPLEFGPYFRAYSTNAIEGQRYSLGVQTSNDFSRKIWLRTFGAYGTLDQRWKYGASAEWILNKSPRTEIFAEHTRDIDQLGMMGFFDQGNGLNSALQLDTMNRLSEITRTEISMLHEFGSGWGQSVEFRHRSVAPRGDVLFVRENDPTGTSPLVTAELTLQTRYARNEKFVSGAFERVSLGSKWPVLTGTVSLGIPRIAGSEFNYQRWSIDAEGTQRLGPIGRLEWWSQAGMYTGRAPVVLTELQPANETALSINEAFNLLRFMEFASDRWARGCVEWHGEGLLLGRLPVIKNLHLREVVGVKGVISSWDPRHETVTEMPSTTTGLSGTYAEAVFGVENLFRVLRIDVHRRVTESMPGMREPWGVRVGLGVEL
ncbi:MAG: DUF5686 family protein [Flavobacteriales bacterium]|nr:DUF5686 family protein [Flavobacteriales bacterium]